MTALPDGYEGFSEEDRSYLGSRFSVVQEALFSNPYQKTWGAVGEPPMPTHKVTFSRLFSVILPFDRLLKFQSAVERAVDSSADLRWGPDGKGFRRLLHPNGICLTGLWRITEETGYSGYFRKDSQALIVARYSTCCTETRRGHVRSLSMVGKLFPTTDRDHVDPLRTANFITQQDIGGDYTDYINDAELRNAPNTTLWRRGAGAPILIVTGATFGRVVKNTSIRQLYEIAELGKPKDEPTRAPTFMRLLIAPDQPRIPGDGLDFRDEIMAQIYDRGVSAPKRTLTFNIELTDEGETHGLAAFERRTFKNWRQVGTMTFDKAAASYNGDFVIHFNHPTWRSDQNDPATATRVNQRKVR
jgi:hypothetical protein